MFRDHRNLGFHIRNVANNFEYGEMPEGSKLGLVDETPRHNSLDSLTNKPGISIDFYIKAPFSGTITLDFYDNDFDVGESYLRVHQQSGYSDYSMGMDKVPSDWLNDYNIRNIKVAEQGWVRCEIRNINASYIWGIRNIRIVRHTVPTVAGVDGVIGWYSGSDPSKVTLDPNGNIAELKSLFSGGLSLYPTPDGAPSYDDQDGAIVWPQTSNKFGLFFGGDAFVKNLFVVATYMDGQVTSFDDHVTITTDIAGINTDSEWRSMGAIGTGQLYTGSAIAANMYSDPVELLPMNKKVIKIGRSGVNAPFKIGAFGANNRGADFSRSWRGRIYEVIATNKDLRASETSSIRAYLEDKYSN